MHDDAHGNGCETPAVEGQAGHLPAGEIVELELEDRQTLTIGLSLRGPPAAV